MKSCVCSAHIRFRSMQETLCAMKIKLCYSGSRTFGALAQPGERMAGSHEVRGSIPLCSTIKGSSLPLSVGFFYFQNLWGIEPREGKTARWAVFGRARRARSHRRERSERIFDPPMLHHLDISSARANATSGTS